MEDGMRMYRWDSEGSAVKCVTGAEYKTVSLALNHVDGEDTVGILSRILAKMIQTDVGVYQALVHALPMPRNHPAVYWRTFPEFEHVLGDDAIKLYARYVVDVDVEPDYDFVEWDGNPNDLAVLYSGDAGQNGTRGARGIGDIP